LFLQNLILYFKAHGLTVLPMGATGIAAELLPEGTTVHKRLCKRRHVKATSEPWVEPQSKFAHMLRNTHGIIIDEISAQHRDVLEFVDRLFKRALPSNSHLNKYAFAGKVI